MTKRKLQFLIGNYFWSRLIEHEPVSNNAGNQSLYPRQSLKGRPMCFMGSLTSGLRGEVSLYLPFFALLPKLSHLLTPTSPVKNQLLLFYHNKQGSICPTVVPVCADGTG